MLSLDARGAVALVGGVARVEVNPPPGTDRLVGLRIGRIVGAAAIGGQRGPAFVEPHRQGAVIVADALAQMQVREFVRQQRGQAMAFLPSRLGDRMRRLSGTTAADSFGVST